MNAELTYLYCRRTEGGHSILVYHGIFTQKKATELKFSLEIYMDSPKEGRKKTQKYTKQNEGKKKPEKLG